MVVVALMVMIGESVVNAEIATMSQEVRKERYSLEVWLCSDTIKENLHNFLFMFYIFIQPERPNFRHSKICNKKVNLQSQLKAIFTKIGN